MDVFGACFMPVSRARCVPVRVARSAARRGAAVTCCRGEGEVRAAARPRAGVWRSERARLSFACVRVCVLAPGRAQRFFHAMCVSVQPVPLARCWLPSALAFQTRGVSQADPAPGRARVHGRGVSRGAARRAREGALRRYSRAPACCAARTAMLAFIGLAAPLEQFGAMRRFVARVCVRGSVMMRDISCES